MKSLLLLFSALKLGKLLTSAGSMLLAVGVQALVYGWRFAAGLVGLLFVHEMGHYLAARQRRLDVSLPFFIPFVGAWINLREAPPDAETEAYVAYAGPFIGTLGAFACYWMGRETGDAFWLALAKSGFVLNLFNMIPVSPLDGGRITAVLTPRVWLLGVPCLIGLWAYWPSPILILVSVLAVPQLIAAWRYDPRAPANQAYYGVLLAIRAQWALLYIGLVIVLALFIQQTQELLPRKFG